MKTVLLLVLVEMPFKGAPVVPMILALSAFLVLHVPSYVDLSRLGLPLALPMLAALDKTALIAGT